MKVLKTLSVEKNFLLLIAILVVLIGLVVNQPQLAMWVGFMIAGYSAIANDSIQTLGTFIASNKKTHWAILWLFIAGILVITHVHGYLISGGDIAFERLSSIPQPDSFSYLQLASPIILLILTRFKIPVSTSFLLLAAFSSKKTIEGMLSKTFMGYVIAFVVAMIVWWAVCYLSKKFKIQEKAAKPYWRVIQWCTTAFLWSTWLMHDTANVAVFLPRTLTMEQAGLFIGFLVLVVGYVLYKKGDRIQEIVEEKSDILDVRSATAIDFVYALVLLYFKELNSLPMSTTWVFLGLLAGREIAMSYYSAKPDAYKNSYMLVGKDIARASVGLVISLLIAWIVTW